MRTIPPAARANPPALAFGRRIGLPSLALAVALSAGLSACKRDAASPDAAAANPAATATPAPVARFDARLSLVNNNGAIRYDGTLDSEANRKALSIALAQAYSGQISGNLNVDKAAKPAPWLEKLPQFAAALSMSGAAVSFEGEKIELSGQASDADRAILLEKAKTLFPGYQYGGLFEGVGGAAASTDAAAQALAALEPGKAGPAEIVKALNQINLRFDDGGARIAPASLDILSRAAKAIQAGPADARYEIVGPGGGAGQPSDNETLSRQRAEAVKVQLIVAGVNPGALDTKAASGAATTPLQFNAVK
ncbi:OmpA family protein [Lysobacter capsici]|uniref:OmpA family protein n=1 Tax=Lysobacter capsici TaxID=435897 RepID=UPI00287B69AB|nr:OmpA family protein [Lysobacter capsici]WND82395.1 OmpA family protein [Lysobacter capsici]WND87591.1 OmpA family protein [Lysobacter capsici]